MRKERNSLKLIFERPDLSAGAEVQGLVGVVLVGATCVAALVAVCLWLAP